MVSGSPQMKGSEGYFRMGCVIGCYFLLVLSSGVAAQSTDGPINADRLLYEIGRICRLALRHAISITLTSGAVAKSATTRADARPRLDGSLGSY